MIRGTRTTTHRSDASSLGNGWCNATRPRAPVVREGAGWDSLGGSDSVPGSSRLLPGHELQVDQCGGLARLRGRHDRADLAVGRAQQLADARASRDARPRARCTRTDRSRCAFSKRSSATSDQWAMSWRTASRIGARVHGERARHRKRRRPPRAGCRPRSGGPRSAARARSRCRGARRSSPARAGQRAVAAVSMKRSTASVHGSSNASRRAALAAR